MVLRGLGPRAPSLVAVALVVLVLACGDDPTQPPSADDRIAFQSDRTGNFDIYVMQPDGSGLINLTQSDAREVHPAWSPDKSQIAFVSDGPPAGLRVMNADGTGVRSVLGSAGEDEYPAWSHDGRFLAFRSARSGPFAIWVVAVDGTGLRQVTEPGGGESFPTWSPDGRIAYALGGAIYEVASNGAGLRQLTFPDDDSSDGAPAWSRDGTRLVFQRSTVAPGFFVPQRLYVVSSDGSGLRRLTNPDPNVGVDWTPAWSPGGTRIAFAHETAAGFDVFVMRADGSNRVPLTTEGGVNFRPAW